MSARSISALPTCLYRRLGSWRVQLPVSVPEHTIRELSVHYIPAEAVQHDRSSAEGANDRSLPAVRSDTSTQEPGRASVVSRSYDGKVPIAWPSSNQPRTTTSPAKPRFMTDTHLDPKVTQMLIVWEEVLGELTSANVRRPKELKTIYNEHQELVQTFIGDGNAEHFRRKWDLLSSRKRLQIWPHLLVGLLVHAPESCVQVLTTVNRFPRKLRTVLQCLHFIHVAQRETLASSQTFRRRFKALINWARWSDLWKTNIPARYFDLLLTYSGPKSRRMMIRDFLQRFPNPGPAYQISILNHHVRAKEMDEAIDILRTLPRDMLEKPSSKLREARNQLLSNDTVARTGDGFSFAALPQLLTLGIEPDADLHNAVLHCALTNGVSEVAWDLYKYLQKEGMHVNARSHFLLLRDAFKRGNVQGVDEIMTRIHEREDLHKDPYLVAYSMNIVRIVASKERTTSVHEALSHILSLYDRVYSPEPLQALGILGPREFDGRAARLPPPSPHALSFVVWSYVLVHRREASVNRLWDRITTLFDKGTPEIVAAMQLDIIHNAFALFYSRQVHTLPYVMEVLQHKLDNDMLPRPTQRLWGTVICAYLKHGQVEKARHVMSLMQARGRKIGQVGTKYVSMYYPVDKLNNHAADLLNEAAFPPELEEYLQESKSLKKLVDRAEAPLGDDWGPPSGAVVADGLEGLSGLSTPTTTISKDTAKFRPWPAESVALPTM